MDSNHPGPLFLLWSGTATSQLGNCSAAFICKLCCHWLMVLWQRQIAVAIQAPGLYNGEIKSNNIYIVYRLYLRRPERNMWYPLSKVSNISISYKYQWLVCITSIDASQVCYQGSWILNIVMCMMLFWPACYLLKQPKWFCAINTYW